MKLLETNRKCPLCGAPMYVDDVDKKFTGNFDRWINCTYCECHIVEYWRFHQLWKEVVFDKDKVLKEAKHNIMK